jgi:hypothetical protein
VLKLLIWAPGLASIRYNLTIWLRSKRV